MDIKLKQAAIMKYSSRYEKYKPLRVGNIHKVFAIIFLLIMLSGCHKPTHEETVWLKNMANHNTQVNDQVTKTLNSFRDYMSAKYTPESRSELDKQVADLDKLLSIGKNMTAPSRYQYIQNQYADSMNGLEHVFHTMPDAQHNDDMQALTKSISELRSCGLSFLSVRKQVKDLLAQSTTD